MPRAATSTIALATTVALCAAFAPAVQSAPDDVPDRGAVLAEPIERGELVLAEVDARTPSEKVVDGDAADWIGVPTRIGGASRWDAGEYVHTDFLFDAHGADDGRDRDRLEQFGDLFYAETRTQRIDQVLRTSGSQLGVPEPLGAPDEYGDVDGGLDVADLTEVRLASDGDRVHLLASVANLTDPTRLGVLVLADSDEGDGSVQDQLGTEIRMGRYETAVLLTDDEVRSAPLFLADGDAVRAEVAVGADGYDNHLEAALPTSWLDRGTGTLDLAVVAGRIEDDGSFTPLNVAFRGDEPVEIYNDRAQAFALLDGTVDAFSTGPIAVDDLVAGRTQHWDLGSGYHERHMTTARPDMTREAGQHGIHQPYGLYVPTTWERGTATPLTYWLHYRGGKAHSGTVINPRLTTQLGEERGNVVAFPHGRGTSEWYVTESHQDVFDVMADVEELVEVDEARRYVSGYSMGGYGSWLFASLYPDLFAAAFVQSGAITQGAWVGGGGEGDPFDPTFDQGWVEANDGDARAQLTYRAVENLQHVPFAIDHGTNDELALNPQIERMAEKLTKLGYTHRFTRFLGYEHFTQAIMDEWADGAAYLDQFTIDPDPREVTYAVVPSLVHALNTVDPAQGATFDFRPDGAYWVDGITVREQGDRGDGRPALDAKGTVRATAHAIPAPGYVTAPDPGAVSPVGHSTPFVRTGLQRIEDPTGALAPEVADALTLDLTNVASVAVDSRRARLDRSSTTVTITTDGDTVVRLSDLFGDGEPTPDLVRVLAAGFPAGDGGVTVHGRVQGRDLVLTLEGSGTVIVPLG